MPRRAELALALGIAALVVALRAPLFDLALERDEGEYAYIAWRMGHGELPYRDAFDQKPPGIFLAYRLARALPGDPVVAIRALAALASAAASLALYALVRGLLGPAGVAAAAWSALLLGFLSADAMIQGSIANTELLMLPFMLAAAALLPRAWTRPARAAFWSGVAVGALLGVATAMKQVAIVNAPLFMAVVAWRLPAPQRAAGSARFAGALLLGGVLAWAPLLLWLAQGGALAAGLDAFLFHNLAYAAAPTLAQRWQAFTYHVEPLLLTQAAAWALAALGLALLARRTDRFPALFLAGFAAFNALGVGASGRFFPHYFQQLLPAVAALAGSTAAAGFAAAKPVLRHALPAAALLPLLAGAAFFWRLTPDAAMERIYPGSPFEAMPAIAREIAGLSAPDQRVFVYGSEPQLLFYAQRASASRYIILFPLFGEYADVAARWQELEAELRADPPAVIAWMPNQMTRGGPDDWLEDLVRERYVRHAVVIWDDASRGRIEPHGEWPAEGSVWASLWQRRDLR